MWKTAENRTPQSADEPTPQPPALSPVERPVMPTHAPRAATQNQESLIGKSIVIKGEITAAGPLYIDGSVEGLISAPDHRVTIRKGGKVKADISAREVVIMGSVKGNLNSGDRVEIRSEGSLTGDLAAQRISIEDGAFLKGAIEVCAPSEPEQSAAPREPEAAMEAEEAVSVAEPEVA